MPRISLCLVARNEEAFIGDCLSSVRRVVDEMIVLDTGSTDRTVEIARARGARVLTFVWCDDFAAARNAALAEATGDWVLVLDADERLAPGAGPDLRRAVETAEFDCGMLPLHDAARLDASPVEVLSGALRRGEPVLLPRLLRRTADLRWEGALHESVAGWLASGRRAMRVDVGIVHFGNVAELREARAKAPRNLNLLRRRCLLAPEDSAARTLLARELLRAGHGEQARHELEKAWGLVIAPAQGSPAPLVVGTATLRAFLALESGDLDRAAQTLALVGDIAHPNLWMLAAALAERRDDLASAEALLVRCLRADGELFSEEVLPGATSWTAQTQLGVVRLRRGHGAGALEAFDAARALRPDHLPALLGRAEALGLLGRGAQALRELEPVLRLGGADGWLVAAAATLRSGRDADAVVLREQARLLEHEGWASLHRADLAREVDALLAAVALREELGGPLADVDVAARLDRARELTAGGELESALACYVEAVRADVACAEGWRGVAAGLLAAGALHAARRVAEVAVSMDPAAEPVLVDALMALGELPEATAVARRWFDRTGHDGALAALAALGVQGPRPAEAWLVARPGAWRDLDPLATTLRRAGWLVRCLDPAVIGALSAWLGGDGAAGDPAAVAWLVHAEHPGLVVCDVALPGSDAWQACGALHAVPVVIRVPPEGGLGSPGLRLAGVCQPLDLDAWLARNPPVAGPRQVPDARPLSVIVPTCDRSHCLRNLFDRLAVQDLPPSLFEVVVVDDGSPQPVNHGPGSFERPYNLNLLRQDNAGPAAARNTALDASSGRWVVFYNDDTVPAVDNLRLHLLAQVEHEEVVLGTFDFPESACARPFVHLLQHGCRLFEYPRMNDGELHSWRFFYTCNLSLPRAFLDAVGGFDAERFPRAICEDLELGLRLERDLGQRVRFRAHIRAGHDHDLDVDRFRRRAFLLGYYHHRIFEKHDERDMVALVGAADPHQQATWLAVRARAEYQAQVADSATDALRVLERRRLPREPEARERLMARMDEIIDVVVSHEYNRGHAAAAAGLPDRLPVAVVPRVDRLTSIIVPNLNGMPHVRGMLDSLRRHLEGPAELIVVDNGSTDDSLPWLAAQPDVTLVELGHNAGAPAARNHGLAVARGDTLVFCDNDVVFTPGWQTLLYRHLDAWPDVGLVGPMSDCVVGAQRADREPARRQSLDEFARTWTAEHAGEHHYTTRLILFFLAARRELIDDVGGIDECYGRWGFEDDDLSLRAGVKGWRLRIAHDCFIQHLGSRTAASANLDYDRLLLENWEVFKRRWGIDPALPYGKGYDPEAALAMPWDPARHRVPLPEREPESLRLLVPAPKTAPVQARRGRRTRAALRAARR